MVLPYLAGRPAEHAPFPRRAAEPGFWQKQRPSRARLDSALARPDAERGQDQHLPRGRRASRADWAANFGAMELAPLDVARRARRQADLRADRHRPRREHTVGRRARTRAAAPHRAGAPRRAGRGQAHGAARRPHLGRRGRRAQLPRHPRWTSQLSKAVGAVVPELISWKWDRGDRGGRARLDYTQNVHHKTLVAPYSLRAAAWRSGFRADRVGRTRRPVTAARRLHHPQRARARGRARRPVPHRPGPQPAATGDPLVVRACLGAQARF